MLSNLPRSTCAKINGKSQLLKNVADLQHLQRIDGVINLGQYLSALLTNSGATFNRMMRKLLLGCDLVDNCVDDIIGHATTWTKHMKMLRELLRRLAEAELTIKPSKCHI
jgi:hypothetical protein